MKKKLISAVLVAVVCAGCQMNTNSNGGAASTGLAERLVLGGNMSFEECNARGGLIIQDASSPMVACDPRVKRRVVVPADEFDHPTQPQTSQG